MVKHTQTIRWQKPTNCLSVFDHFAGLALKGLRSQFLKKFLVSNFSISNADGNTSEPLHRGGIAHLLLLRILIDNKQVWRFQEPFFNNY